MHVVMNELPASWYCDSEKSSLPGLCKYNVLNIIVSNLIAHCDEYDGWTGN